MTTDETLALILERLTALEAKSDDTRPMHEQNRAEIAGLRQEMKEMRGEINGRLERVEKELWLCP
jgi:hypothetical protein